MSRENTTSSGYDYIILIPAVLLVIIGLIMVYSASSNVAEHRIGESYFFLKKQALFCAIGFMFMIFAKHIPCSVYRYFIYPLLIFTFLLLVLVLIPGVGHKVGGATRWLKWGWLSLQPAEFAKFTMALYMAYSMSKKGPEMGNFSRGLLPHLIVAGFIMLLIVRQPDLGTAVIIGFWVMIVLFVGGAKFSQLVSILIISSPAVLWLIYQAEYRLDRIWTYLNPWRDPTGSGFQIIHSFLAFGSGGVFGEGLGNSKQKLFYLPESHTDFVLSIIGEEMGFIGVIVVIILFGVLIWRGIKIALNASDLYSTYLALGLTCLLGFQVIINMGVVMGLLPTKGLTLPLISYGGSSLVLNLLGIGILLNISSDRT
ncbi:putative lipid II flippase FtsW [Thermodesulfobacteriota bacterium]